jgi:1-deoxy-D-xylulose-5-phosphate synthase
VKPLDGAVLRDLAGRLPLLCTLEENTLRGGFGSAVHEFLAEAGIGPVALHHVGLPDRFITHGTVAQLLEEIGLSPARLVDRLKPLFRGRA